MTETQPLLFEQYHRQFFDLRGQRRTDRLAALASGDNDRTGWGRQDTLQAAALLLARQVVVFRVGLQPDGTRALYRLTYSPNLDTVQRLFNQRDHGDAAHDEEIKPDAIVICEDGIDHFAAVISEGE